MGKPTEYIEIPVSIKDPGQASPVQLIDSTLDQLNAALP